MSSFIVHKIIGMELWEAHENVEIETCSNDFSIPSSVRKIASVKGVIHKGRPDFGGGGV